MLENLINKITSYNPNGNIELVVEAYHFAEKAHEGQFRKSGESYFIHPFNVSMILADYSMDVSTICAGLLHDVIEDTEVTYEAMSKKFGVEITDLVDGVTKLKKLKFKTKQENQAENLRKMIIAMAKDVRVIIIKLADRLHNSRTLTHMSEAKRKEKAMETLEIYAPIAHRLGMSQMKAELEDISLRFIDPAGYYDLVEKVNKKRVEREKLIDDLMSKLGEKLDETEIEHEISGRPKHFYSIYKKMYYQNKSFEQIFDLTAIRVLVDNLKDCYGVLGIVHTMWKPIPGRFKDYIAMPKPNMYQSLHTTVIGPSGEPFEIQIRTWDMHRVAEYGIAAHWKYKEGVADEEHKSSGADFESKLTWIRQLMEWQNELKDPEEFMESLKIDFFNDEVFVFTPQGDVIDLPAGSTPIDFAYKVHSAVGNKCVGAKIDGRIAPLDYKLKNGNIVEILTSQGSAGPSRDWLKIVKSSQAKTKIRNWFKKEEKDENIVRGKDMLEKEVKHEGYRLTELLKEDWLKKVAEKLSFESIDDLYAAVGYGSVTLSQVLSKLKEMYREHHKDDPKKLEEKEKRVAPSPKKEQRQGAGVIVKGIENIKVKFSRCCNPVPGDEIIGYVTKGRGVSVHRRDCMNIAEIDEGERLIEVEWAETEKTSYKAEIQVKASDRTGLLTEITLLLAEAKLAVSSLNARTQKDNIVLINMTLEINNVDQLKRLMKKIKGLRGVMDVYRVTG